MRILLCLIFAGCTIIPKPVVSSHASIGQNGQANSDVVSASNAGYEIDQHGLDRYNALIDLYGKDPEFQPSLIHDQGISRVGSTIMLDREGMRRFLLLNEWRRMGRIPPPKPLLRRLLRAEPPYPRPLPPEYSEPFSSANLPLI